MELNDYKHRVNERRYIEVEIVCDFCGKPYWAKWSRVNKGLARFCSRKCSSLYRADGSPLRIGKENAYKFFEETRKVWLVYWFDEDRKRYNSTLAKWLWEQDGRTIPPKHVIYYKDGDPNNCVLDNLVLVSKSKLNSILLVGHKVSDETKRKVSLGNSGKVRSEEVKLKMGDKSREMWNKGIFDYVHYGESNWKWRGGTGRYPKEFNKSLRDFIKSRDNYKCRACSVSGKRNKTRLEVHHIDGNVNNNVSENLMTLCSFCHHSLHDNRKETDPLILSLRSLLNK